MSTRPTEDVSSTDKKHRPFVPENMEMKELTFARIFLGLILTVVLGAANAYLGLRAGITIAATYPAAVIAMAVLRAWKGSLLEENIARTAGSIGERSRRARSSRFRLSDWRRLGLPSVRLTLIGNQLR